MCGGLGYNSTSEPVQEYNTRKQRPITIKDNMQSVSHPGFQVCVFVTKNRIRQGEKQKFLPAVLHLRGQRWINGLKEELYLCLQGSLAGERGASFLGG